MASWVMSSARCQSPHSRCAVFRSACARAAKYSLNSSSYDERPLLTRRYATLRYPGRHQGLLRAGRCPARCCPGPAGQCRVAAPGAAGCRRRRCPAVPGRAAGCSAAGRSRPALAGRVVGLFGPLLSGTGAGCGLAVSGRPSGAGGATSGRSGAEVLRGGAGVGSSPSRHGERRHGGADNQRTSGDTRHDQPSFAHSTSLGRWRHRGSVALHVSHALGRSSGCI